jgi:hypothetical protein
MDSVYFSVNKTSGDRLPYYQDSEATTGECVTETWSITEVPLFSTV